MRVLTIKALLFEVSFRAAHSWKPCRWLLTSLHHLGAGAAPQAGHYAWLLLSEPKLGTCVCTYITCVYIYVCIYIYTRESIHVSMYVCMYVCMYACMYVCVCIYVCMYVRR